MLFALDFECNGLDYYRKDFQVLSLSLSYRTEDGSIKSKFVDEPDEITAHIEALEGHEVIVHNASYELGVIRCCFPQVTWEPKYDTMRLVQVFGLPPDMPKKMRHGAFGLKKSVQRILGLPDWAEEIKEHIRSLGIRRGQEMANIHLAPRHLVEAYNKKDSEYTLRMFEVLTSRFASDGYDWEVDHGMYFDMTRRLVQATIEGIPVDREGLAVYRDEIITEVAEIERIFLERFADEIMQVRQMLLDKANAKRKKVKRTELPEFNPGSKDQLEMLCCSVLGMTARKKTAPTARFPQGKASFRSADLGQWGDVGKLLAKRGKRLIVKAQADSILGATEYDGKLHPTLKSATITGRLASGDA